MRLLCIFKFSTRNTFVRFITLTTDLRNFTNDCNTSKNNSNVINFILKKRTNTQTYVLKFSDYLTISIKMDFGIINIKGIKHNASCDM